MKSEGLNSKDVDGALDPVPFRLAILPGACRHVAHFPHTLMRERRHDAASKIVTDDIFALRRNRVDAILGETQVFVAVVVNTVLDPMRAKPVPSVPASSVGIHA